MLCNLLDTRGKMRMWVSIYNPFVSDFGIDEYFNTLDYPRIIHHTLPFFLYPCLYLSFVYQILFHLH